MTHESFVRFESRQFPNVVYILYRPNATRRAELAAMIGEAKIRVFALAKECMDIAANPQAHHEARANELRDLMEVEVHGRIIPRTLRWGLQSVEGFVLDGEPQPTVDAFIEGAPSEVLKEAYDTITQLTEVPVLTLCANPLVN